MHQFLCCATFPSISRYWYKLVESYKIYNYLVGNQAVKLNLSKWYIEHNSLQHKLVISSDMRLASSWGI